MAEDIPERGPNSASTSDSTVTAASPRKFPKGVVLGKDGKPCRSCTSFADWASQAKKTVKSDMNHPHAATAAPPDCPPDVEELGRSSWTLLHSITASYPVSPTPTEQSQVKQFLGLFSKLYPCWVCAEDFQDFMTKSKIRAESRDEFGQWMCEAHNEVNRKLGKTEFDCSKWEQRWRTGWKDGRCD